MKGRNHPTLRFRERKSRTYEKIGNWNFLRL